MRPLLRLGIYATVWVATLLLVPLIVPPAREPSYGPPAVAPGDAWTYGFTSTYEGPPVPAPGRLHLNLTDLRSSGGAAVLDVNFSAQDAPNATWPFRGWEVRTADGRWVGLAWACANGTGYANFSGPLAVGLVFPLGAGGSSSGSSPSSLQGACGLGPATVEVNGSYDRAFPPGGAVACVLYVCNAVRTYHLEATIVVLSGTVGPAIAAWHLWGEYDPSVSGFRTLSVTPGTGGYRGGSTNLTLASWAAGPTMPTPDLYTEIALSALLLLAVPLVVLGAEAWRLRREGRRADASTREEVLAALPKERARQVASDLRTELLEEEETAPRGPD